MSKLTGVLALAGLIALSMLLLNCGSSSSRPAGLLFVASQAEDYIVSFAIDLNTGSLSQVGGTPTTCSTLSQSPAVACGLATNMLLDPTQTTAFLLNQGVACVEGVSCADPCGPGAAQPCVSIPPTIYGYTVNSDGSLSSPANTYAWTHPTSGTDTEDDADTALSMVRDAAGKFLFVISSGSTRTQANNYLADCPHAPNGNFDACPSISVFSTTPGSTAVALTGNNCTNTDTPCPYRLSRVPTALSVLTFTPPNSSSTETLLFVTSNKDLTSAHNDSELSVFTVDSSGNLVPTYGSPYTTQPNPASVQAVNTVVSGQTEGGVFAYVGAQASGFGTVSGFQLCTVQGQGSNGYSCSPSQVTNGQLIPSIPPSGAGKDPSAMVVDSTNSFLYVAATGSNQVFGYSISEVNGTLTSLTPASVPSQGASPFALAMHSSTTSSQNNGVNFLYVSNIAANSGTNQGSGTIGIFSAGVTNGSLSTGSNFFLFTDNQPSAMAAK